MAPQPDAKRPQQGPSSAAQGERQSPDDTLPCSADADAFTDSEVRVVVVMGVSGSGKSSVGAALAGRLGCPFLEGDSVHPPGNIAKMAGGQALEDADRVPWLMALHAAIERALSSGSRLVVACSALKPAHRAMLAWGDAQPPQPAGDGQGGPRSGRRGLAFVLLDPGEAELARRLAARQAAGCHFFPPCLLPSQLAALSVSPHELWAHVRPRGGCCSGGGGGEHADHASGGAGGPGCFPTPDAIAEELAARLLAAEGGRTPPPPRPEAAAPAAPAATAPAPRPSPGDTMTARVED